MRFSEEEAEQFYRLWFSLLSFVHNQTGLSPRWPEKPLLGKVRTEDAMILRDEVWANLSLLDAYIESNPDGFSEEDLQIIASWHYRRGGDYLVLKQTKKYTEVISQTDPRQLFGVQGLISTLDEILPALPMFVKMTLIPFKDRIVFDGILISSQIFLGRNMTASFKQEARDLADSEGIILTLPPDASKIQEGRTKGNQRLLEAFRRYLFSQGLSEKVVARDQAEITEWGNVLLRQSPPIPLLQVDLASARKRVAEKPSTITSIKRFARFLVDTERGEAERVWELQEIRRRTD